MRHGTAPLGFIYKKEVDTSQFYFSLAAVVAQAGTSISVQKYR